LVCAQRTARMEWNESVGRSQKNEKANVRTPRAVPNAEKARLVGGLVVLADLDSTGFCLFLFGFFPRSQHGCSKEDILRLSFSHVVSRDLGLKSTESFVYSETTSVTFSCRGLNYF
jgi:hypothetical protein